MKRALIVLAAVVACAAVAVPALAGTRTVRIGDNWFVRPGRPSTVHIRAGSILRFQWTGSSPHNVVVARGPRTFRSPQKVSGTWSRRLTRRGHYLLLCTIHPATMRLNVIVR